MDSVLRAKTETPANEASAARATGEQPMFDLIELVVFAYRDFVGYADRLLESFGFGRAHHRVLHFVNRHSSLTIAELLDILRITKQSLSRVLKDLLDEGYVEQRHGVDDRRQRQLFPTSKGRDLALQLARLQSERFSRALAGLPDDARSRAIEFLTAMIDPDERDKVTRLVWPRTRMERGDE